MHIKESWVLFFNYSLIALVGIAFPIAGTIYFGAKMANIWPWFLLLSLCLVTIAVLMIYFLRKKEIRQVFLPEYLVHNQRAHVWFANGPKLK